MTGLAARVEPTRICGGLVAIDGDRYQDGYCYDDQCSDEKGHPLHDHLTPLPCLNRPLNR
jgi:hypothetical protein